MNRARWIVAAACVALCCTRQGAAQGDVANVNLRGAVVDATGGVVPGADVVIFREGATVAHARTDDHGEFTFNAPAREYQTLVHAPGFAELRSAPVPFAAGSLSRFTLRVGYDGATGPVATPPVPVSLETNSIPGALHEAPVRGVASTSPWEVGALFQGGFGLTDNRDSFRFLLAGVHVGKILTHDAGKGLLRGNFEYAGEFFPYWQAFTPRFSRVFCNADPGTTQPYTCSAPYTVGGTATGVSVTPIILRWNFTHGERWMPWVQGAGGVVWTNHKFPAVGSLNTADLAANGIHGDSSVWNFTPQFGVGTHLFVRPRRSLDLSANAIHISSASLGDRNPGVNASVQLALGYTWWK